MKLAVVALALACFGCGDKKPSVPKVPAPPDLVYIKGSCIIGALTNAKACEVVQVKGIGPALDCHDVLIKMDQLACLPAPKK